LWEGVFVSVGVLVCVGEGWCAGLCVSVGVLVCVCECWCVGF
jgi:hypothetical protein